MIEHDLTDGPREERRKRWSGPFQMANLFPEALSLLPSCTDDPVNPRLSL